VAVVETPDPGRVRIRLKRPWPDFMTFYATATGASWIVPRKYRREGRRRRLQEAPIGAGPYRFVCVAPGVESSLRPSISTGEKCPNVKRLVLKAIPDEATRLAALKRGEVDIAYCDPRRAGRGAPRNPGADAEA